MHKIYIVLSLNAYFTDTVHSMILSRYWYRSVSIFYVPILVTRFHDRKMYDILNNMMAFFPRQEVQLYKILSTDNLGQHHLFSREFVNKVVNTLPVPELATDVLLKMKSVAKLSLQCVNLGSGECECLCCVCVWIYRANMAPVKGSKSVLIAQWIRGKEFIRSDGNIVFCDCCNKEVPVSIVIESEYLLPS